MTGCYVHPPSSYERCPAYAENFVPANTYDPNHVECSVWYEWYSGYFWSSYDKLEALDLWAKISKRPMYYEGLGIFRYSVKADDGFVYYFWNMEAGYYGDMKVIGDTLYNISVDRLQRPMPL